MKKLLSLVILAGMFLSASASVSPYGQCGGTDWDGDTECISGYTCTKANDFYSQCLPGDNNNQPGSKFIPVQVAGPTVSSKSGCVTTYVSSIITTCISGGNSSCFPGTTYSYSYYTDVPCNP